MPVDRAAARLARFHAAQRALISQFRELPPGAAEAQSASGAWSAAQIACHVAMANEWTAGVLTGATPLAQPAPAGFTERFTPLRSPGRKRFRCRRPR